LRGEPRVITVLTLDTDIANIFASQGRNTAAYPDAKRVAVDISAA